MGDPANPGYSIQAGKQQSKGVDIDLRWQATPSWAWIAAFTAQKAEITEDSNAAWVGKQLFNVPEQTARLATRYDFRSGDLAGLGLGLGLTHNSKLPGNQTNTFFTPANPFWIERLQSDRQKLLRSFRLFWRRPGNSRIAENDHGHSQFRLLVV